MKTKKILSLLFTLFILQQSYSQVGTSAGKQFIIQGHLTGVPVDSVILYYKNAEGQYNQLSQHITDRAFTLSGLILHPESAHVLFKKAHEVITRDMEESRMREFYIEPLKMLLNGNPADLRGLKLIGSKTQTEFEELEAKTSGVKAEMQPIDERLDKETDHEKAAAIRDELIPYNTRIKKITYQFFLDHPASFITLTQMQFLIGDMKLDSIKTVYNAFSAEFKSTPEGIEIENKIKNIERGMPGQPAPLFTKKDINGNSLSLAGFKGKYVMLDFWASWCVPCRKGNPHMISLYNKYKSKGYEVIGISDDDRNTSAWNAAVAKDGVGIWHHVLRGLNMDLLRKHIQNPNDLDQSYGIASIPTKILIDPNGKIIGRFGDSYGGSDEDMDKMLASIFDK